MVEWHLFPSGKRLCKCHDKPICPSHPSAGTHKSTLLGEVIPFSSTDSHNISKSYGAVSENPKTEVSSKIPEQSRTNPNKSRRVSARMSRRIIERFHAYRVKFNASVDWDALFKYPEVKFDRTVFKRIDFDLAIVKVFRASILVTLRSKCELRGLSVKEAKLRSDTIISEILSKLPKAIIIKDSRISSLHNAFMNHPTAKHDVNVSINGEKRLISDNSQGVSEFEAIHPEHAVSDSEILEFWNADLLSKPFYLPSQVKQILDVTLKVQYEYAEQIKKHLKVQDETLLTLKAIRDDLYSSSLQRKGGSGIVHVGSPPLLNDSIPLSLNRSYRLKRARQLLEEYGW